MTILMKNSPELLEPGLIANIINLSSKVIDLLICKEKDIMFGTSSMYWISAIVLS